MNCKSICMNWKIKCNWGSWRHCEPLTGFTGGPGGKALAKIYNI